MSNTSGKEVQPVTEPWISVEQVAAHLGVGKMSVYRWIEHRRLPATKIGKLWKFKLSEVERWMRAQATTSGPGDQKAPIVHPAAAHPRKPSAKTILVIDDDEIARETLTEFLADEGYQALLAADGAAALELLRSPVARPSLILLDLGMPHVDGRQFRAEQLRDPVLAPIPVIVVTADRRADLEGTIVLRKPLRLNQLATEVERLLGG